MKARTVKALIGSIRKWQRIISGVEPDRGVINCPLCAKFYTTGPTQCEGCPVFEETGLADCRNTPYWDFSSLFDKDLPRYIKTAEQRAAAAEELRFLVKLLPKRYHHKV